MHAVVGQFKLDRSMSDGTIENRLRHYYVTKEVFVTSEDAADFVSALNGTCLLYTSDAADE